MSEARFYFYLIIILLAMFAVTESWLQLTGATP